MTNVRFLFRAAAGGERRADHDQRKAARALRCSGMNAVLTPYDPVRAMPE
jgi:hypothetical protein